MPPFALAGTIAIYLVLAVLLLSLNIFSLWRWWVKAAAIIVTAACVVVAYFTISAMIGWPSVMALPQRFNLVATRIIEPDRATGAPGHVYLWVEELNANYVPVTAPRGYEMPYSAHLADDTQDAQSKINSGQKVLGQSGGTEAADGTRAGVGKPGDEQGQMGGNIGNGTQATGQSAEAEIVPDAAQLTFSDMPAVTLPDKALILPNGQ